MGAREQSSLSLSLSLPASVDKPNEISITNAKIYGEEWPPPSPPPTIQQESHKQLLIHTRTLGICIVGADLHIFVAFSLARWFGFVEMKTNF